MIPEQETIAILPLTKAAIALAHLKNNRIEYLILGLLGHMVGLTASAGTYISGVCY
jgi:hypothetical protein